jgi:hypothetical protein
VAPILYKKTKPKATKFGFIPFCALSETKGMVIILEDKFELLNDAFISSWEMDVKYSKTYYVDNKNPLSSDEGPGTFDLPFLTIGQAAKLLKPGEMVIVSSGVYREIIRPKTGGNSPTEMICYEAAPNEEVIIKGSKILNGVWRESNGWNYLPTVGEMELNIWSINLDPTLFERVNPFAINNLPDDMYWLTSFTVDKLQDFFKKTGMIFLDGVPLEQLQGYAFLSQKIGFWVEKDGYTLHISLPSDKIPSDYIIEATTNDTVFCPDEKNLSYIKVKGFIFEHSGNAFPVPQKGLFSTNFGHHWIIEDNTIRWANSTGIDVGNRSWNCSKDLEIGSHIIRSNTISNCGLTGLVAFWAPNLIVTRNKVLNCGWHDAEMLGESAAVKFHLTENLYFANNIINGFNRGCGIWLDFSNINCRITSNIFNDITTGNGAILIEATHCANKIDNNIITNINCTPDENGNKSVGGVGIFLCGTDYTEINNNIILNCMGTGLFSNAIVNRLVDGRGGTARNNAFTSNIIHSCKRSSVEWANEHNLSQGNIYSNVKDGYIRIGTSDAPYSSGQMNVASALLNLESFNSFYKNDFSSKQFNLDIKIDNEIIYINSKGSIFSISLEDILSAKIKIENIYEEIFNQID